MSSTEYRASTRDMKFILHEVLKIGDTLLKREEFEDFGVDDINMVIDEAAKFAETILGSANKEGDREGCSFDGKTVTVPKAAQKMYNMFCENGWNAVSAPADQGGQGLPNSVAACTGEMFTAANTSFMIFPGLTIGVARLLYSFGSDWLKEAVMPKLFTGEWSGTMMLTEPNAGSDVADVKTVAKRQGDHYLISGTKMFISAGDHELTPNIIHAVLARLDDAPSGIKGISLFAVPKYRLNPDGSIGEPNDVACGGIEEKIGLHGSPTCLMNLGENDQCEGYLLGEENKGIQCMFQMMNEARVGTGLQGVALAGAAYINALSYAKERVQGVAIENMRDPDAAKVEIIKHPDVRRMLLTQKAYVEGTRMMLYWAAYLIDMAESAPTPEEHDKYMNIVELLTPICKAYPTDHGFRCIELAIQTMGGYGCTREYPVEQHLRDVKIASIYEGTNGIQALDLLGRKIAMKRGMLFMNFMGIMNDFAESLKDGKFKEMAAKFSASKDKLAEIVMHLGTVGMSGDALYPVANATPLLNLFGDVLTAYMLLWQATVADEKLAAGPSGPDKAFYTGKLRAAEFFIHNILPQVSARAEGILSGDRSVLEIAEEEF